MRFAPHGRLCFLVSVLFLICTRSFLACLPHAYSLIPLIKGTRESKKDKTDKTDCNAHDHLAPYHAKAHTDAQSQRADDTDNNGKNRFAGNFNRRFMLHFPPNNERDNPKQQSDTAEHKPRFERLPLRNQLPYTCREQTARRRQFPAPSRQNYFFSSKNTSKFHTNNDCCFSSNIV